MQKLYYSISEVCKMVDEEQHILRYWEKEFPHLKPRKNRGGNRIYSEKDINLIKLIKSLLRNEKLSLKGAKEQIIKFIAEESDGSLFPELEKDLNPMQIKDEQLNIIDIKSKKKNTITFNKAEAEELLGVLKRFSFALSANN